MLVLADEFTHREGEERLRTRVIHLISLLCSLLTIAFISGAAIAAEPPWIFGCHDPGGYTKIEQAGKRGWLVVTVAIGHNPNDYSGGNFTAYSNRGHGVIVRLNNGYGSEGTLPYQSQYQNFAQRCANYVAATQGADIFIIGNETNLPREWPGNVNGDPNTGEPITVARYIDCYNRCYNAIKAVKPTAQVCPTPSGTWSPPWPSQGIEGFLDYWINILNGIGASKVDGLILHAYTHGCDPALVTSNATMGPPYQNIYYNFRVYRNYLNALPAAFRTKPVYITECDQNVECADPPPTPRNTWYNVNNGWVKAIYSEINSWNSNPYNQKIRCVALFRWDLANEGEWSFTFSTRENVVTDWLEAMANDYRWNQAGTIAGYVRNKSGQGISGATVTTNPGGYSATSGSNGYYAINNVPSGTYDVTASKSGYGQQTQTGRTVYGGATTTVSFTLTPITPIGTAKTLADGVSTLVSGIVTAKFPVGGTQNRIYIEETNRTNGIGIATTTPVSLGDEVQVVGTTATSDGERILNATSVTVVRSGIILPGKLGVIGRGLGGGAFGRQGAVIDNAGSNDYAEGLSNIGILVRVWGRVTYVDPSGAFFYLDDGSGVSDGSGWTGIRVACSNLPVPTVGSDVVVTGISGATIINGKPARLLRPRSVADLSYASSVNLLSNPGFEAGSLANWTIYGTFDGIQSGTWFGDITAHSGSYFAGSAAHGGTKTGGLYQRVAVSNGSLCQARAWSRVYRSGNPTDSVQNRVGIDPTGGTNPSSASVQWSAVDTQPTDDYSTWRELVTPTVTCSGGYVTVFLDAKQLNSVGWHINCFDDAQLVYASQ